MPALPHRLARPSRGDLGATVRSVRPATRSAGLGTLSAGVVLTAVFALAWLLNPTRLVAPFVASDIRPSAVASSPVPFFNSRFASTDTAAFVNSSSVAALPGGDLLAVWFAGTREGASDVHIDSARFDASAGEWGEEVTLATRESTQSSVHKHIRKLGNPVIAMAPNNRLWLFYVSVSMGGWAGSTINSMHSDDLGHNWSRPNQLVTTPFLNISTLVRSTPVFHADGSMGLPVYHEFLGKFAEYLYLGPDGEVVDKFRISRGNHSLQPTIVPLDGQRAVALMRYAGDGHHRVLASRTEDAGQTWSEPYPEDPSNPNSSLAAIGTPDNGLLVALNDLEDGRFRLRLKGTDEDLGNWRTIMDLDASPDPDGNSFGIDTYKKLVRDDFRASSGPRRQPLLKKFLANIDQRACPLDRCEFQYEYPYFTKGHDGLYHLVYSWNNTFIKHISFNDAWLAERL